MGLTFHLISICVILVAYEIIRNPLLALKETIQIKIKNVLIKLSDLLKEIASK